MKKVTCFALILTLIMSLLIGCKESAREEYTKYSDSFFDTFDTLVQVVAYTKTEEEFEAYFQQIHSRFQELHKLYDIYNNYEGINNIKTINDKAGIEPVKVDKEIMDLIIFAKDWYQPTDGRVNIALGPVLKIWHDYRQEGEYDPVNAKLPPMEELFDAFQHTDIEQVLVDTENSTVYLADENMSLDVGAVAKGYATEIVAKEMIEKGLKSGIISAGGSNVRIIGKPLDNQRERWGIGIQNPDKSIFSDEDHILETIFLNNASVVSSGDYQRYYIVDGKPIHHIIDPKTLMPGQYHRAVTIVTEDSGLADLLSTAVFLMPYEEGKRLIHDLEGVEALWIMHDGTVEASDGMREIMKSQGATGARAK